MESTNQTLQPIHAPAARLHWQELCADGDARHSGQCVSSVQLFGQHTVQQCERAEARAVGERAGDERAARYHARRVAGGGAAAGGYDGEDSKTAPDGDVAARGGAEAREGPVVESGVVRVVVGAAADEQRLKGHITQS